MIYVGTPCPAAAPRAHLRTTGNSRPASTTSCKLCEVVARTKAAPSIATAGMLGRGRQPLAAGLAAGSRRGSRRPLLLCRGAVARCDCGHRAASTGTAGAQERNADPVRAPTDHPNPPQLPPLAAPIPPARCC